MSDYQIQRSLNGSTSAIVTETGLVKAGQGVLRGITTTVTSSGTLVISDALEASTVAVGTITQSVGAAGYATHALGTFTSTGASVAATHAVSVLTGDAVVDGNVVVIGSITYTAKTTPSLPYHIKLGLNLTAFLANLKAAINGTSIGTLVSTGTIAHSSVIATTNADDSQVIQARIPGSSLNALATTDGMANTAWGDTTLVDGVTTATAGITIGTRTYTVVTALTETSGATAIPDQILWVTNEATFIDNIKKAINGSGVAGVDYSTGTTANTQVFATTNAATTQVIQALTSGVSGNSIATTASLTNYAWGATTLASGAGADSRILLNTYTPAAGSHIDLNNLEFERGLYATVGGTSISATFTFK